MKQQSFFIIICLCLFFSCAQPVPPTETISDYFELQGKTMGTTYKVLYTDSLGRDMQSKIENLLEEINQEVSTYIPDSRISTFNQDTLLIIKDTEPQHFRRNFEQAQQVYQASDGWFNPAVMPLVRYWGFGDNKKAVEQVDSSSIDSLLAFVQFGQIVMSKSEGADHYQKPLAQIQLDFSAIAKGDAVDEIGRLLEQHGIANYLVEIGGEVRCRGLTNKQAVWKVGINVPKAEAALDDLQEVVELKNLSMATSGNYRNFYEVNGIKYAHTINPKTGYPEKNTLLSASVFSENCATADAYATAFMAMGLEAAFQLVENDEKLDAYFIYSDEVGKMQVKYTKNTIDIIKK